jgi:hypothetical protein
MSTAKAAEIGLIVGAAMMWYFPQFQGIWSEPAKITTGKEGLSQQFSLLVVCFCFFWPEGAEEMKSPAVAGTFRWAANGIICWPFQLLRFWPLWLRLEQSCLRKCVLALASLPAYLSTKETGHGQYNQPHLS